MTKLNIIMAALALFAIAASTFALEGESRGLRIEHVVIGTTPARIYHPPAAAPGPVVVIAHGFAGSQQLMQSFALTYARNGYSAVTFDFPGHGRNPAPLTGSITETAGATQRLVASTRAVMAAAKGLGDGRLVLLGHSMASDIVVRAADGDPDVAAVVAVSMFSPAVTASVPRNLLIIVGDWEDMLKAEALRAAGLAIAPREPVPGTTYGDFAEGTARRVAFSAHTEHASVLYSDASMREALAWTDLAFGVTRSTAPALDGRGPWILLLVAGTVLIGRPLAGFLPRLASPGLGAGLSWRRLWLPALVPMISTPLLLRVLPTHFLPVLVGDYLAAHFAVYGLITALCMRFAARDGNKAPGSPPLSGTLLVTALAVAAFGFAALAFPIDRYVTSFVPGPERWPLLAAMLVGTLGYFLADEWLTRGAGAGRFAYPASKLAFLVSLSGAVALDFERLFFLIIIVPVIVLFFLIHGLISGWAYRATGHPFAGGIANAIAFAWAIGVTFPLLAG